LGGGREDLSGGEMEVLVGKGRVLGGGEMEDFGGGGGENLEGMTENQ